MEVKDLIKTKRIEKGMTMKDLSIAIGVSEGTISRWESGKISNMKRDKIAKLSKVLGASIDDLMGWDNPNSAPTQPQQNPNRRTVKIYGRIAAGAPIEMIEDVIDEVDLITLPEKYDGEYFGLQIKGDSMEPDIRDGDYVIFRRVCDAESGSIVAVTVNGADATCKRLMKYADGIRLVPINPRYEPIYFTSEEVESKPVKVIGLAMESRHRWNKD